MNKPTAINLEHLRALRARGEKIACLTVYDAGFTRVLEAAGIELFIIGDSLGMVVMGYDSTEPVTMEDMVYHAANVARVGKHAYRIVDLPAGSYASPAQALTNARRLVEEGGAHMVKLEGGVAMAEIVGTLTANAIPVCGHVGLLPQSVRQYGGYKVQGRELESAMAILADARALQAAGAGMLVIECVPASLAEEITAAVSIPTIGIGAGPACDGQVLVLYDMLGISQGRQPRFVHDFLAQYGSIPAAIRGYIDAVKSGHYPAAEHSY